MPSNTHKPTNLDVKALVRLGDSKPELRPPIRKVLAAVKPNDPLDIKQHLRDAIEAYVSISDLRKVVFEKERELDSLKKELSKQGKAVRSEILRAEKHLEDNVLYELGTAIDTRVLKAKGDWLGDEVLKVTAEVVYDESRPRDLATTVKNTFKAYGVYDIKVQNGRGNVSKLTFYLPVLTPHNIYLSRN